MSKRGKVVLQQRNCQEDIAVEFCLLIQNFEEVPDKMIHQAFVLEEGNCCAVWDMLVSRGWQPLNPSQREYLSNLPDIHFLCDYYLGDQPELNISLELSRKGPGSYCTVVKEQVYELWFLTLSGQVSSTKLDSPVIPMNYIDKFHLKSPLRNQEDLLTSKMPFLFSLFCSQIS